MMRFTSAQHLKRTAEFIAVRANGRRRDCGAFFVHCLLFENAVRPAIRRVGVVASKRVGNAVERNRAKRLLREVFRHEAGALPENCDVVLTARRSILKFDLETLRRRFSASVRPTGKMTAPQRGETNERSGE